MTVTRNDVVAQMRTAMALADPEVDTTIGTPIRKVFDVVGEQIAGAYVDRYLLDYRHDIDSRFGADLDDYAAQFGHRRRTARRATGSITFERSATVQGETLIPANTQVSTDDVVPVVVQTLVPALMARGATSLTVPAVAVLGGAPGNIAAGSLVRSVTPLEGVGSFTNTVAFTGGTDAESDEQFKHRFKRTIFRNMAGVEDMFLATALEDEAVSRVNVIGAAQVRREQVQVTGGTATSTLTGARYVYPRSVFFGPGLDTGSIFIEGVHYTFDTATRTITRVGNAFPDGVYDLEFEYVPAASRNDPAGGVTNRVDVYVNGERPTEAAETAIFRTARAFNTTPNDPLNVSRFRRADDTPPVAGNYFIDLSFGPVLDASIGNTLVINGVTYTEGTHYWTVGDITNEGGTGRGFSGFEFRSAANGNALAIPPDASVFSAEYVYNAVPGDVEAAIRAWRLTTVDVRAHAAKQVRLDVFLAVILTPGLAESAVRPAIEAAVRDYVNGVGFAGVVQVSDVLAAVHAVPGIDAVRFLTSSDVSAADQTNGRYAMQRVTAAGAPYDATTKGVYATDVTGQVRRAIDVIVSDDEVPVFNAVHLAVKAQNSWGAV